MHLLEEHHKHNLDYILYLI